MAAAAEELLAATTGDVLCFLPGVSEIQRTIAQLQPTTDRRGVNVLPLHGSLGAAEQDAAVRSAVAGRRRVIVATNLAETSLTVPGVTGVIDSGLCKVARYDADRAIDSLTTERISQDSADQRAGRAGRTAAGQVRRLWDQRDRLRPHSEPEIHRVDLSSVVLDVMAWGGDPRDLEWFDAPSPDALDVAIELLRRLGAASGGRLTKIGQEISRLPLHPRLACMLHAAGGARSVARVCALLSDRHLLPPRSATTSSDLLSALDHWLEIPTHVDRVARQLEQLYESVSPPASAGGRPDISEADFRRAVFAGYPDRIAQRREAGSPRVRLATGSGAVVSGESGVRDGEFMAAVDLRAQPGEARIRIASRVEREWLTANAIELVHTFDAASGVVRAAEVDKYDALILRERPVPPEPEEAARLLADAWISRGEDEQLVRRLRFAGHDIDVAGAVRLAAYGRRALADVKLSDGLPSDLLRTLESAAPRTLSLPSGKVVRLEYLDDGRVKASARLQDVFGLFETPRLGPAREPVLFALLAPNGRPVQLTTDLRSFWERTYPDVRKELRGRYPKHRWPESPLGPASKAPTT
jgi:ATP-dependent helicase HrpB